eukprot:GHVS01085067.1.p1 GENE.GHVS01085067.1~~GHVS01085067.1.p1  ORF type:complete len:884 (+),score=123.92 GHVS01085067.1:619-3270(+)
MYGLVVEEKAEGGSHRAGGVRRWKGKAAAALPLIWVLQLLSLPSAAESMAVRKLMKEVELSALLTNPEYGLFKNEMVQDAKEPPEVIIPDTSVASDIAKKGKELKDLVDASRGKYFVERSVLHNIELLLDKVSDAGTKNALLLAKEGFNRLVNTDNEQKTRLNKVKRQITDVVRLALIPEDQLGQTKSDLTDLNNKFRLLNNEKEVVQQNLEETTKELQRSSKAQTGLRGTLATTLNDLKDIQKSLEDAKNQKNDMQKLLDDAKKKQNDMQKVLVDAQTNNKDLIANVRKTEKELTQANKEKILWKDVYDRSQAALSGQCSGGAFTDSTTLVKLIDENKALEAENTTLKDADDKLKDQNKALEAEQDTLNDQKKALKAENTTLKAEDDNLKDLLKDSKMEDNASRTTITDLQEKLKWANVGNAILAKRLDDTDSEPATLIFRYSLPPGPIDMPSMEVMTERMIANTNQVIDHVFSSLTPSFNRGDARRLKSARRRSVVNSNNVKIIGTCIKLGSGNFQRYGRFGDGLSAEEVDKAMAAMDVNDVTVQTYFGRGSAVMSDVVRAYPSLIRDAVAKSPGGKGLTLKQLVAPKAVASGVTPDPSRQTVISVRRDSFRPDINNDISISFLLMISREDLRSSVSSTSDDVDALGEALRSIIHHAVYDAATPLRGKIADDAFLPSRVLYLGSATKPSTGTADSEEKTKEFASGLPDAQVQAKFKQTPAGHVLVQLTIVGAGDGYAAATITAQEAFRHLRFQIDESPKKPIGRTASIVYATNSGANSGPASPDAGAELAAGRVIPVWLILVCVLVPVFVFAALLGIIWRAKRLACCCMPRYGTEAGSLEQSAEKISSELAGTEASSYGAGRRAWLKVCKTVDKFVTRHLV